MWKDTQTNKEVLTNNSIDENLNKLEEKISKLNTQNSTFGYEKNENWDYYPMINWVKLELPINTPKKLIEVLKFLQYLIITYQSLGNMWELYAKEGIFSKWDYNSDIDIYIKNSNIIVPDTIFLKAETIRKNFWLNDSREKMETQKIADFLNKVLKK